MTATDMYAYVADGEGIVAFLSDHGWIPLVGINPKSMTRMREQAQEVSNTTGKTIRLLHYTFSEEADTVVPDNLQERLLAVAPEGEASGLRQRMIEEWGYDPTDPASGPAEDRRVPVTAFDEPVLAPVTVASGIVVSPILGPQGVGVALTFTVQGEVMPPIGLLGPRAEDLVTLAQDALTMARRSGN